MEQCCVIMHVSYYLRRDCDLIGDHRRCGLGFLFRFFNSLVKRLTPKRIPMIERIVFIGDESVVNVWQPDPHYPRVQSKTGDHAIVRI